MSAPGRTCVARQPTSIQSASIPKVCTSLLVLTAFVTCFRCVCLPCLVRDALMAPLPTLQHHHRHARSRTTKAPRPNSAWLLNTTSANTTHTQLLANWLDYHSPCYIHSIVSHHFHPLSSRALLTPLVSSPATLPIVNITS